MFAQSINGITGQLSGVVIPGAATTYSAIQTFPGADFFMGGIDGQSGTSYTLLSTDENKLTTFNNASAVAVTLPQATTGGFGAGAIFYLYDRGAGTATVTPTTSTINGGTTIALAQGQGALIVSDGTNYSAWVSSAASGSGANAALSNLTSVAINTSLLASVGVDLGSTAAPFRNLFIYGSSGSFGSDSAEITGTFTGNRTWTLPDSTDTFVGLAATQTLTNKSIAGTEVNSGVIAQAQLNAVNAVASSATPTFNLASGNIQTFTATSNVTSITITNIAVGVYTFYLCENATGGFTWPAWPASVHGEFSPGTTLSTCSIQSFVSPDGTHLYATSTGIINQ